MPESAWRKLVAPTTKLIVSSLMGKGKTPIRCLVIVLCNHKPLFVINGVYGYPMPSNPYTTAPI